MKILALDLGTHTGFALEADDYPLACGTFELGGPARNNPSMDMRFFRLLGWIEGICTSFRPDKIVYEDVQFVKSRLQAHLWATWRAAVWLAAWKHNITVACCPTGTLKKFATGDGHADKIAMARALAMNPRFIRVNDGVIDAVTKATLDDNAVDALHLLRWAQSK